VAAWQRLRQARAIAERESASLFPDLEGSALGEIERSGPRDTEGAQLGLASAYEVDLWGRIRSRVQAEEYRVKAARADYQTAALSLSAELVRAWYRLVEARSQADLLTEQIETNRKVLRLLETRFARGLIRGVDVLRQRQLLEASRERKSAAESRVGVLGHQISVLLGRPPGKTIDQARESLPCVPALPDTGLPVRLVRRRPDVRAAYNRLKAASAETAAAISNRYPRLTLTASLSTSSTGSNALFEQWARSFAGDLVAPLLDAGQRAAEADRARAVRKQRLYEYGRAILASFREVEDALIQERKQLEQVRSLTRQVRLAKRSYRQLRIQYLNGVSDFIDVLTALDDLQQLRRDLLAAKLQRLEFRMALYRALAGGFDPERMNKDR
jgi:NodT family efflux transporter outer membrane factor (OMF) lipoprotein